jgi:nucleoid DNA-binding protein
MNLNELVDAVSSTTGLDKASVRKTLDATFATISAHLKTDDAVRIEGFGNFMKKPGKDGGEARVVFRLPPTDAQKEAKKQKKKLAKKGEGQN